MTEEIKAYHYQELRIDLNQEDERVKQLPEQPVNGRSGMTLKPTSVHILLTDRTGVWREVSDRVFGHRVLKDGALGRQYQIHRYAWTDEIRDLVGNLIGEAARRHLTLAQKSEEE